MRQVWIQAIEWLKKREWKKIALLVAVPFAAFYLMQFVYGGSLADCSWKAVLGNAVCIGALYYMLCGITGNLRLCGLIVCGLGTIFGAANFFVAEFRGNPVLPWDFTALKTAMAVSGSYQFRPTWQMIAAILMLAGASLMVWRSRKGKKYRLCRFRSRVVIFFCGILCMGPVLRPEYLKKWEISSDVWDQAKAYRESGIIGAFLSNLQFMEVEIPEGYSREEAERLLAEAEQVRTAMEEAEMVAMTGSKTEGSLWKEDEGENQGQEKVRPHIIAIMNESWADFEEPGYLELSESPLEYTRNLEGVFGHAYTSVFGAGTSTSEFEFLTGHSMAFLPSGSIPYQQYILESSDSMASVLKENGYRTVAFHPGERSSWQRDKAYPLLGFDQFKCGEDMNVEAREAHGYISDESDFAQVIYEYENREPGEKLFLFNVTIQNHGSYTDQAYETRIQLTDEPGVYPMAEQYLTLEGETDDAFRTLVEYFEKQQEPVLIVMFGDHQPAVEQALLDKAYGVKQEDMDMEEYMGKFRVPFVIWNNYGLEIETPEITSLNFLGRYVMECAGIEEGPYGDFLNRFCREIPALTFAGYFDETGNAHSHLETNTYKEKIKEYQIVQYYTLFDRESDGG